MRNLFKENQHKAHSLLVYGWIIFSVIYIGVDMYNKLSNQVYQMGMQNGYAQGRQTAVSEIVQRSLNCQQPVALTLGEGQEPTTLINLACLQQPAANGEGAVNAPAAGETTPGEQ